jgi:PilZ domain
MDEKRKIQRGRTLKAGTISLHLGGTIDCIIRNLSSTGARLEVASPFGIPDSFILLTKPDRIQHPCRVRWRKDHHIGVVFQKADRPTRT